MAAEPTAHAPPAAAGERLAGVPLAPGYSRRNALTYLFSAFVTIGMLAFVSFIQPFLLNANLAIPEGEQGRALAVLNTANEIVDSGRFDLARPQSITNAVFHILRNAHLLDHKSRPNLIVCWGGHSINREEYEYTKRVGYELGLRGLDVCTGCGPGAMKGPMKGATIGHAKQRFTAGRYVGLTE
ncbi:MAG: hypothetical protein EBS39_12100, partial [Gammaproteobacteria bacterium]|nr:hypothetical protein [Gammaproteobacteria bacterium]